MASNHTIAPIYLYAKGTDTHNQFSSVKANKLIYSSEEKDTFLSSSNQSLKTDGKISTLIEPAEVVFSPVADGARFPLQPRGNTLQF